MDGLSGVGLGESQQVPDSRGDRGSCRVPSSPYFLCMQSAGQRQRRPSLPHDLQPTVIVTDMLPRESWLVQAAISFHKSAKLLHEMCNPCSVRITKWLSRRSQSYGTVAERQADARRLGARETAQKSIGRGSCAHHQRLPRVLQ